MAKEVTPEQIEMLDGMVAKARAAAEIIATYDQERVDRLCQAVAASVIDMYMPLSNSRVTGISIRRFLAILSYSV